MNRLFRRYYIYINSGLILPHAGQITVVSMSTPLRYIKKTLLSVVPIAGILMASLLFAESIRTPEKNRMLSLIDVINFSLLNNEESMFSNQQTLRSAKNSRDASYASYMFTNQFTLEYGLSGTYGTLSTLGDSSYGNKAKLSLSSSTVLTPLGGTLTTALDFPQTYIFPSSPATPFLYSPSVALTYTQPLSFDIIRYSQRSIEQIDENYVSSLYSFASSLETVIVSATSAFFALISAKDSQESARESEKNYQEQLAIAEAKFSAGTISELDVLNLKVSLVNARNTRLSAEVSYTQALEDFNELLGFTYMSPSGWKYKPEFAGTEFKLDDSVKIVYLDQPVEYYIEKAFQNKYSWLQQEISLKQSKDTYAKSTALEYPSLTLGTTYSGSKSSTSILDTLNLPYGNTWYAKISYTLMPLQTRTRELTLESAVTTLKNVEFSYEEAREDLIESVIQKYNSIKISEKQIAPLETSLQIAREAYKASEARYAKGSISVNDLIKSQETLVTARNNLITAKKTYFTNYNSFLQLTAELLPTYRSDLIEEYGLPWPK